MITGDDHRATAAHCRFAAATTSHKPTADMLREMATEYDRKAHQADAEEAPEAE
jgi:hypothetical protein